MCQATGLWWQAGLPARQRSPGATTGSAHPRVRHGVDPGPATWPRLVGRRRPVPLTSVTCWRSSLSPAVVDRLACADGSTVRAPGLVDAARGVVLELPEADVTDLLSEFG